ncbi:MAG: hypothetical protein JXR31_14025, partial [Prolixibacteraceae bacterium]|nr:hypothetical protein [Prolixibacteraceae bacterium]
MKIYIVFLFVTLIFGYSATAKGKWKRAEIIPHETVCYASGKVEKSFIPPPENIVNRLKSGKEAGCDIVVTYSGFPESVKNAFEYAVNIWEQLIESDVPIYMTARWQSMDPNTLASCGPTGYYQNLDNFYYRNRFYAIAVAEKIEGEEITDSSSPDISASFNKNIEWYYGTDGNCPDNKYDFVSTVLHELTHGLGFTGFFYAEDGIGEYYDPPAIFDQFVANYQKQFLTDTDLFENNSAVLFSQLVSNALYFRSPAAVFEGNGSAPRLYAPTTWDDGSSIYHLNDFTYPAGNINSLMTHAAGYGEVIHNPGPLTLGIMADIGWKNMFIRHEELRDIETVTDPVIAEVGIESDFQLDSTSLYIVYSSDNFNTSDSVLLNADINDLLLSTEIPVNINRGIISYYISATDEKQRTFRMPSTAPDSTFRLRIGPDEIDPVITHQPKGFILTTSKLLPIEVKAEDNIGIDSVWVEYFYNKGAHLTLGLKNDSPDLYSASINLEAFQLLQGDSVSYRIVAQDVSSNRNISYLPETDYFRVKVEEVFDPLTYYINDFNDLSNNDFINDGFEIKKLRLFLDGALQTIHPYESPEQIDMEYNYTSQLKYPIILQEGG